jgi:hypothetical protein
MTVELRERLKREHRDLYAPAEEDQIRAAFMSYLAYRAALLRMAATYSTFTSIPDPELRARAFLVGYGSGAAVYRASLALVTTYRDEPPARRKLNEADGNCGIAANTFETIYLAVANERNASKVAEMAAYYEAKRDEWRAAGVLTADDFDWVDHHIRTSVADIRGMGFDRDTARFEQLLQRVKLDSYTPVYAAQSVVSTLIGDCRCATSSSPATSCSSGGTGSCPTRSSPASGPTARSTSARRATSSGSGSSGAMRMENGRRTTLQSATVSTNTWRTPTTACRTR